MFRVFVVIVGVLMLAGAVNTAIVGSNGVLNRVSEDGILPDWFRQPHRRFGTSYRILNLVVGLATRHHHPEPRKHLRAGRSLRVRRDVELRHEGPGGAGAALQAAGRARIPRAAELQDWAAWKFPWAWRLITLTLFALCIINLFTKQVATVSGIAFTLIFFVGFRDLRESHRKRTGGAHVELDQFNVASRSELTPESVGARPGNVLVPISNYHALYHLAATLDRVKVERRDIVVLHVRLLRRSGSGESELEANQLFGSVEQYLFTKALSLAEKRGKTIRLAVVSATDLWDGILRAGVNLQSSTLVLGGSTKLTLAEEAREVGLAWENLPDPRPPFNLEIFAPGGGQHEFFMLGPHAPNLTMNEVNLVHRLWLRLGDLISPEELHHHDVVHFALNEVQKEIAEGKDQEVARASEGAPHSQ